MLYCSWDMPSDGCNCCFSFWDFFYPFISLKARKMKISEQWKKGLEISSFYTIVAKIQDHILTYPISEIWYMRGVIVTFHFGLVTNTPTIISTRFNYLNYIAIYLYQLLSECKFRKFRCFFLLFTVLMKLILEKHITYFASNFNNVSSTANAQTIDSATSKFFFWIGRLGVYSFPINICLLHALLFYENYTN